MRRQEFPQKHRREKPDHTSLLDEPNIRVRNLDRCEGVACCENGVVERVRGVGSGFLEEVGEVGFEGCLIG
jgi:hypothetical protein